MTRLASLVVAALLALAGPARAAAPALAGTWAATTGHGKGPVTIAHPRGPWTCYRLALDPARPELMVVHVTHYPLGRGTITEIVSGGRPVPGNHLVWVGAQTASGPDDGPVRTPVVYELDYVRATGRLVGTRQLGHADPTPIQLAPARVPGGLP